MEDLISKELLSEVLECKVETIGKIIKDDLKYNKYSYCYISCCTINIHKLAHKCKEWALKQGYDIITVEIDNKYYILTEDCWQDTKDKRDKSFVVSETFKAQNTEQESIFKACQWILDNLQD